MDRLDNLSQHYAQSDRSAGLAMQNESISLRSQLPPVVDQFDARVESRIPSTSPGVFDAIARGYEDEANYQGHHMPAVVGEAVAASSAGYLVGLSDVLHSRTGSVPKGVVAGLAFAAGRTVWNATFDSELRQDLSTGADEFSGFMPKLAYGLSRVGTHILGMSTVAGAAAFAGRGHGFEVGLKMALRESEPLTSTPGFMSEISAKLGQTPMRERADIERYTDAARVFARSGKSGFENEISKYPELALVHNMKPPEYHQAVLAWHDSHDGAFGSQLMSMSQRLRARVFKEDAQPFKFTGPWAELPASAR